MPHLRCPRGGGSKGAGSLARRPGRHRGRHVIRLPARGALHRPGRSYHPRKMCTKPEWACAAFYKPLENRRVVTWRSGYAADCKSVYAGSSPAVTSTLQAARSRNAALRRLAGPVAQWLELTAHNGLVAGSSPAGPTTSLFCPVSFPSGATRHFLAPAGTLPGGWTLPV